MADFCSYLESPIGWLGIESTSKGVSAIQLLTEEGEGFPNEHSVRAAVQLEEYFLGDREEFSLAIDVLGSSFYKAVWQAVQRIPYGRTTTYMTIAKQLNNPGAVRAVGMANAKNPIPIIIPCHRVIGSDGSLTGYALGLPIKQALLQIERPKSSGIQGLLF